MSGVVEIGSGRSSDQKEFTVATPQEFVRRFGGNKVITRVSISAKLIQYFYIIYLYRLLDLHSKIEY